MCIRDRDYQTAPEITIHIPSGKVNGYFDSKIHDATEWKELLDGAVAPHFDVLGKYTHLIFPVSSFKLYTPDGKALIDVYDDLVLAEQEFMGLKKYNRMNPNYVCFSVMYLSLIHIATKIPEFVDGVSFMELYNEAIRNQSMGKVPYTQDQIDGTRRGLNPYVFPNVQWYDEMFKERSFSEDVYKRQALVY